MSSNRPLAGTPVDKRFSSITGTEHNTQGLPQRARLFSLSDSFDGQQGSGGFDDLVECNAGCLKKVAVGGQEGVARSVDLAPEFG